MIFSKVYKYENGKYQEIEGVLQGFPIKDVVDDSLDSVTLIINSFQKYLLKEWQSVKIVIDSFSKCFVVSDIQTTIRHIKNSNNIYNHIVSLIEPTKYLEKVVCSSVSFTNKTHTLKQQIERALLNAEPIEENEASRFKLSQRLINFLGNTPGEDFFFEKPLLREVLDTMLSVKNARCEVLEITDFNNIVIDYYDQTKLGKEITISETNLDIINKQEIQNIEMLGTDIEAYGDNSFSGNREPIYHPSPRGWDSFKTEEAILNDNNAVIKTAFPIEKIVKFELKDFPYHVEWRIPDQTEEEGFRTYTEDARLDLDITENVVDEEVYRLLDEETNTTRLIYTDELYKQNTIHYSRGSNLAGKAEKFKNLLFSTSTIQTAGLNAIYKFLKNYFDNLHPEMGVYGIKVSSHPNLNYTVNNAMVRIQYIPYIDAHVKIGKSNYKGILSSIFSNQSEKTIDLGRYGRNLYGQINRLGNKEITVDKILRNYSEAFDILDYSYDGYVVVERELAIYNNYIKAHYKLTKDYNNISEKIGIDRKKRIYNIPLESFVRDILIKNYIIASFDPVEDSSVMINEFLKTFNKNGDITRFPITNVLVQTDAIIGEWFELPVVGYAMANSILFKFKFEDNVSAGLSFIQKVIGGRKQYINKYVDDNGEYNSINIRLFNDKFATRPTDYNTVKLLPKTHVSYYQNVIMPFKKKYLISKDAYEHHQFTIQFEIASDNQNIIIGLNIANSCSLLTETNIPELRLFVSTSKKYSFIENQKAKGIYEENQSITIDGNSIVVSGDTFRNNPYAIKSWGITDNKNNLLIGVNGSVNRIYFSFKNTRV